MDVVTATRLVASSFAASTLFAPQACYWVVSELAVALGLGSRLDIDAGPAPGNESDSSAGALLSIDTVPAAGVAQLAPSGTVPVQPQAGGPGSPEPPVARPFGAPGQLRHNGNAPDNFEQEIASRVSAAPYPARHRRSLLAIAVFAILAVSAGAIILLNQQSHDSAQSSPPAAPAAPAGTHAVNRKIFNDGSLLVTLTNIRVRGSRMRVDVAYRNTTSASHALACAGYEDPSIVTVSLANGRVLRATNTYCSDHPSAIFILDPGTVHVSYAIFTVTDSFAQPFSFHWPYGAVSGSVSGIKI
jgi:hypothetical protein